MGREDLRIRCLSGASAAALTGALFAGAAAAAAETPRSGSPQALSVEPSPSASIRAIEEADRIAVGPLEEFERRLGVPEARRALSAARRAREKLEAARVSDRFVEARREELTFFNHLVPGFDAFLARPGAEGARGDLAKIVARGRRHRELSRESLGREARRRYGARS